MPDDADPDSRRKVRRLLVEGNVKYSDSDLLDGLANRPPLSRLHGRGLPYFPYYERKLYEYDPVEIARDRARIESYYKERGYFRAKVVESKVERVGEGLVDVTFKVTEGKRTTIRSVTITGAPGTPGNKTIDLTRAAGLKVGQPMVYDDYDDAKGRIRARLVKAGYAFARVDGQIRVDRRLAKADVIIKVDPGPKATFGTTKVVGRGPIPEESVRARIGWKQGQPFRTGQLSETRRRLYALGVFSTVNLEYDKQRRPEVADVTIRLRQARRHVLKAGGGVGFDRTRYESRLRGGYSEEGFLMPLLRLDLEAKPSAFYLRDTVEATDDERRGLGIEGYAKLTKQDFLSPLWQADGTLSYDLRNYSAYTLNGPRVTLNVARKFFGDKLHVGFGWRFRYQDISNVPAAADKTDLGIRTDAMGNNKAYRVGSFMQNIAYDARDNVLAPRRGVYAEVRLEESGAYAGSAFDYFRVLADLRAYWPVWPRLVVAGRISAGRALSGDVLPITERFYVGGASSQRGFGLQRLSPRVGNDQTSVPVGGRAMVETSAEVRVDAFKMSGQWSVVMFLDGGENRRDPGDVSVSNLHWALGAGLRWHTPFGPIRFDVARRLNRFDGPDDPDPNEPWAWHLSLGEAF